MISSDALKEFKHIWSEEFGEVLPDDIALDEAVNLLMFFKHTYRPIRKEWERN
jgi:hypothetical protein